MSRVSTSRSKAQVASGRSRMSRVTARRLLRRRGGSDARTASRSADRRAGEAKGGQVPDRRHDRAPALGAGVELRPKGPALRPQGPPCRDRARRRPAHPRPTARPAGGAAAGACPGHARSHLPAELTEPARPRDPALGLRRRPSIAGKSRLRPWRRKRAPRDRCIRGRRAASGRGPGGRPSVDNRTGRRRWRGWCCGTSPRARRPRAPSASGSSFAVRGPPPGWSPSGRAGGPCRQACLMSVDAKS